MKKTISILTVLMCNALISQNIFPTSGNVGIGTTNPMTKLDVNGVLQLYNAGNQEATWDNVRIWADGQNSYIQSNGAENGLIISNNPSNKILLMSDVGIGTLNPTQKLDVSGNGRFEGAMISSISADAGGKIQLENPSKTLNGTASTWAIYNMTGAYGNSLQFWAYDNLGCGSGLCNNRFTILDNGNVGIGAGNPQNKLDVNGTVHSREVKVDMDNWSDFVFKKEYNLPTLEQVEKHIAEKGHLENIPNEKEVLENGINLGEMNAKLLQKIEELTLYVIEIKKENTDLKKRIEKIEKK